MNRIKKELLIILFILFILFGLTLNKVNDLYFLLSLIIILNIKMKSENKVIQLTFWIYLVIFVMMFMYKLFIYNGLTIYNIVIIVYLIANSLVLISLYKCANLSKNELISFLIYENLGLIIGTKLLAYFYFYNNYNSFNFWQIGWQSSGAWIGVLISILLFAIFMKKSLKNLLYAYIPAPLVYAIGKVGCIFAGCCYGIEYSGIGAVNHPHIHDKTFFPVQTIESIIFTLIFAFTIKKIYKSGYNLQILGVMFINYGFFKFLLDFFRMSHGNDIISYNQIACILIIIFGTFLIYLYKKDIKKRQEKYL